MLFLYEYIFIYRQSNTAKKLITEEYFVGISINDITFFLQNIYNIINTCIIVTHKILYGLKLRFKIRTSLKLLLIEERFVKMSNRL